MNKITPQKQRFIDEYINCLDGEIAVVRAGYKVKWPRELSKQFLADKDVIAAIKNQLDSQIADMKIHKGYVVQKLLKIAEFSLIEEEVIDKNGLPTGKMKLRDTTAALKALDCLCKYVDLGGKDSKEGVEAKIITISNLDDKKI